MFPSQVRQIGRKLMTDIDHGTTIPSPGPITNNSSISIALLVVLVGGAFGFGMSLGKAHSRLDKVEVTQSELSKAVRSLEIIAARMEGSHRAVDPR